MNRMLDSCGPQELIDYGMCLGNLTAKFWFEKGNLTKSMLQLVNVARRCFDKCKPVITR